jgi:hypothetical protein
MNKKLMHALMSITLGIGLTASTAVQAQDNVTVEIPCSKKDASGSCIEWGAVVKGCKAPCTAVATYGDTVNRTINTTPGQNVNAIIALK